MAFHIRLGVKVEIDNKVLRFGHRAAFAITLSPTNTLDYVRTIRTVTAPGNKSYKSVTP